MNAGQAGWTRDLARDLFPGRTTPFAWTLLAGPADRALRNTFTELGGQLAGEAPFWRLRSGYAYLNAAALAQADQSLCGAAWLGVSQPHALGGLRGRLQAGGIIRRCQARLAAGMREASGLQTRLSRWLAWVQGVKWTQADLLQVMEELEPHALAALQTYFLVRAGLNAAAAAFESRLQDWLPTGTEELRAGLMVGVEGLPSVSICEAIIAAARHEATDPERLATLARCSHRGPGEIRPDGLRWPDAPHLLSYLGGQDAPVHTPATATSTRQQALGTLQKSLSSRQFQQAQELLGNLADAMRAADLAWDTLALVMTAAQRWVTAAARETMAAGLITRPGDVLFLELEELKQVATGERHAGDRETVHAAVTERMREAEVAPAPLSNVARSIVCPGPCDGPPYCDSPRETLPPAGATWLAENADPGCAPFWEFAGCVLAIGAEAWSPGMVVARGLGVPASVGASAPAA